MARLLGFAWLALWLGGCPPKVPSSHVCTPGDTRPCTCAGGDDGGQACNGSGTAWGTCNCGGGDGDADSDGDADADTDADADGDADGDADPVAELDRWLDAQTANARDCCVDVPKATGLFTATHDDLVALATSGGISVSARLVDRCITEIETGSCEDWQFWLGFMPGPCTDFYEGLAAVGDHCETAYVCEPDNTCILAGEAYTCQPASGVAGDCAAGCRRGLRCRYTDDTCAEPLGPWEACEDDSECGSNLCRLDPRECVASFCEGGIL